MIGGVIISVSPRSDNRTCLWCGERRYDADGNRAGIGDECGVYVRSDGEMPAVGDDVWWQGEFVFWTPADRRFSDRLLNKVGYSSSSPEMMTGLRERAA